MEKEGCPLWQEKALLWSRLPPDILRKRKAYVGILRVLEAKGLCFQMPDPATLRVFFDSGTKLYENATEAAEDLKKRGFCLDEIKEPGPTAPKQQRPATWERAGADRSRKAVDRRRIREKLRSFHRAPPGTSDSCEWKQEGLHIPSGALQWGILLSCREEVEILLLSKSTNNSKSLLHMTV